MGQKMLFEQKLNKALGALLNEAMIDDTGEREPSVYDGEDQENVKYYKNDGWIDQPGIESNLISDPSRGQEWAQKAPNHGNLEAPNKIQAILVYGPNYKRYGQHAVIDELKILAKFWRLNEAVVRQGCETQLQEIAGVSPEHQTRSAEMHQKFEQFMATNAGLFR